LAPLLTVGWCSDSAEPGKSVCDSAQRSVVGVDTNGWLWLGALGVIAFVTTVAARASSRRQ
jgi:hypothetical protein